MKSADRKKTRINKIQFFLFSILFSFGVLVQAVAFDEDEYNSLETIDEQAEYLVENYDEQAARELLLTYADPELTEIHLTSIKDFSSLEDEQIFLASLDTDEGVRTLNTNKDLFAKYLEEYGISFNSDPRGYFSGYDATSESFITEGKQSTSFSVEVLDNMQQIGFSSFDIAPYGSLFF